MHKGAINLNSKNTTDCSARVRLGCGLSSCVVLVHKYCKFSQRMLEFVIQWARLHERRVLYQSAKVINPRFSLVDKNYRKCHPSLMYMDIDGQNLVASRACTRQQCFACQHQCVEERCLGIAKNKTSTAIMSDFIHLILFAFCYRFILGTTFLCSHRQFTKKSSEL